MWRLFRAKIDHQMTDLLIYLLKYAVLFLGKKESDTNSHKKCSNIYGYSVTKHKYVLLNNRSFRWALLGVLFLFSLLCCCCFFFSRAVQLKMALLVKKKIFHWNLYYDLSIF